jgi:GNAT superfamily N-acetyltransferase
MTLVIRPFDHTPDGPDWSAYHALLARVYGPEIAARRERALRWVTLENPLDLPEARRYVAEEDGRIVGGLGRMPVRLTVAGEPGILRYSHDLLIDPACRGRKLAQQLVRELAARSDSPVGGLWMNAPSYAIHQRCGWRAMTPSRAQVRLLKPVELLARRIPSPLAKVAGAGLRGALALRAWGGRRAAASGLAVEEVEHLAQAAGELWEEVSPMLGVAAVRDGAILRWRFDRAPHAAYVRLIARREGRVRGYLALRLPGEEGPGRIAVAVDLLARPDEPEVIGALAREALSRAGAAGAAALIVLTTLPAFRRSLSRLAFIQAPRPQTFVLANLQGQPGEAFLVDAARWYLTFADSDGDMWTGTQPEERV